MGCSPDVGILETPLDIEERILPDQFIQPQELESPEKALLRAVLVQAIIDLTGPDPELRADAKRWLLDDDTSGITSFRSVSDILNFDGDALRRGILARLERGSLKRPARELLHEDPQKYVADRSKAA